MNKRLIRINNALILCDKFTKLSPEDLDDFYCCEGSIWSDYKDNPNKITWRLIEQLTLAELEIDKLKAKLNNSICLDNYPLPTDWKQRDSNTWIKQVDWNGSFDGPSAYIDDNEITLCEADRSDNNCYGDPLNCESAPIRVILELVKNKENNNA